MQVVRVNRIEDWTNNGDIWNRLVINSTSASPSYNSTQFLNIHVLERQGYAIKFSWPGTPNDQLINTNQPAGIVFNQTASSSNPYFTVIFSSTQAHLKLLKPCSALIERIQSFWYFTGYRVHWLGVGRFHCVYALSIWKNVWGWFEIYLRPSTI